MKIRVWIAQRFFPIRAPSVVVVDVSIPVPEITERCPFCPSGHAI